MPFACLLQQTMSFVAFSFQNVKFHATCNIQQLCSIINVFCFKEPPFCLLWCSLKAIFSCFVPHHALLHISCILLVSKFNANKQNKLTNVNFFKALYQIHKNVFNVFKNAKFGQNPKSIFLQYDVLLRTPSLPFRAYLVHFCQAIFLWL